MTDKKIVRRHVKVVTFTIVVLFLITIGTSYSMFLSVSKENTTSTLSTGYLNVDFASSNSIISDGIAKPMSDVNGLAQEKYSIITVNNSGTLNANVVLSVSYGDGTANNLIPLEFIKLGVYEYDDGTISNPIVVSLKDSPLINDDLYNNSTSYTYDRIPFYIEHALEADDTKSYAIKVWLDESASSHEYFDSYHVNLEVSLNATVAESQPLVYLSGILYEEDGTTIMPNTSITSFNGIFETTSNSSGAFTIPLVPGYAQMIEIGGEDEVCVYVSDGNLSITQNQGATFNGNGTNSIMIGRLAYSLHSTIGRIKSTNNIVLDSTRFSFTDQRTINISPYTYMISIPMNTYVRNSDGSNTYAVPRIEVSGFKLTPVSITLQ